MPPAVVAAAVPAAIGAAGVIGGAVLGSRAQNKATSTAAESTDKALAFNKEQKAAADADYAQRMQQWQAGRTALLQRYGIDIAPPTMSPGIPTNGADTAVPRGGSDIPTPQPVGQGVGASSGMPQGTTIGQMISKRPQPELGSWNDWGAQGLQG